MAPNICIRAVSLSLTIAWLLTVPCTVLAQKLPASVAAAADPVRDGQALIGQGNFPEALAKFGEAQGAAATIPNTTLRLFYQVTSRIGAATALDGMQRYEAALADADWANQTISAQSRLPTALKATVHHTRGVILYHLKRIDDARAMFDQAGREGDKTAEAWQHALDKAAAPTSPTDLVAAADAAVQRGKLSATLILYVAALQQSKGLGDATGSVMERALAVALRLQPSPPVPSGAETRLAAADAALNSGAPAELQAARKLLHESLLEVPWWADGWQRLANVEEKLGHLAAARGALRFYLEAAPQAPDRAGVEQRIASLDQRIGPVTTPVAAGPAPPAAAASPAGAGLSGNWSTQDGRTVEIKQNGNRVSWNTCCRPGHPNWTAEVSGTFDGKNVVGTFHWREGDAQGNGTVSYTLKGNKLEGTATLSSGQSAASVFTRQVEAALSGNWSTQDGRMIEIKQNGNQVSWTSCCRPGHESLVVSVSATFDGKSLIGTYHYREGDAQGDGTLSYTLDGDRLEGTWKTPDGRELKALLTRPVEGNLTGSWKTLSGRIIPLTQNGNQVSWNTCCRVGHPNWTADILGTFDGRNLVGTLHWREGDAQGNGTVSYTLNGNQLEGSLKTPDGEPVKSVLTRQ
jgi:tetratricopeptide (TPR) repeat protein